MVQNFSRLWSWKMVQGGKFEFLQICKCRFKKTELEDCQTIQEIPTVNQFFPSQLGIWVPYNPWSVLFLILSFQIILTQTFTQASLVAQRVSVCLQCRRPWFDPWVRKIPWRRKWQPTPVLLPGKSHGQRSLVDYSPWDCKELDTLSDFTSLQTFTHWMIGLWY